MLTLLSISLLGFFLGMRHATDPDHVIAVTTIVSRERNIFHAASDRSILGTGAHAYNSRWWAPRSFCSNSPFRRGLD